MPAEVRVDDVLAPDERVLAERRPPSRRRLIAIALSVVVIGTVYVFVLPQFASYEEAWLEIQQMTWVESASLLIVALMNIVSYGPPFVAALPGLSLWRSLKATQASTAVSNTAPAGFALGFGLLYRMFRSYGFARRPVSLSLLLTGIWNDFVIVGTQVVALTALSIAGKQSREVLFFTVVAAGALGAGVAIFVVMLRSDSSAHRIGAMLGRVGTRLRRIINKPPVGDFGHTIVKFRRESVDVLHERWKALTLWTIVSQACLFSVFLLTLRHVGVDEAQISLGEAIGSFAFSRLLTAIPITPGSIGIQELALTGSLIAFGGTPSAVLAAALVYRALTWFAPIPFGVVALIAWRRRQSKLGAQPSGA
jgi:uncharacterized membrane protein YbhN (UPF0104 family)